MFKSSAKTALWIALILLLGPQAVYAALGDVISSFAVPGAPLADPRGLAWDGSNLWYADQLSDTIYKLNPSTGAVMDSFASPNVNPAGLAYNGSKLWNVDLFNRTFYTINPGTGISNAEFSKPASDYYGLTYDGANLWTSDTVGGATIEKMNPSGNVLTVLPAPNTSPGDLAWDGSSIWVADGSNTIYEIDPNTGAVLNSFTGPGLLPTGLTFDGDHLWISDTDTGMIYEVDDAAPPVSSPTPAPIPFITLITGLGIIYFHQRSKKRTNHIRMTK